ncbi:hypothetical protein GJU43_14845 [Flavobacterium sp. LC2016-23]|uniref:hypothetical protein n=1 Tax=Flavobacterium sp. LC2016-23 TaxID=2666330 RepID=UPI0012B010FA|nr:hypothetical protein [Flavobacterium sp. LC2016-23]MRX40564.1 hypothetical protein [Flavobacterium sp. LC2016-23]
MSIIKIIANGIEIDIVKDTLTIKSENNALSRDFKVSASSFPFLVIENKKTKLALGTRDLASVKKVKIVDVIVFEGSEKYYGELQILSYLDGFRKCNLRYSSKIFTLMNKKISEFMPTVSVIPGEENPIPYSVESEDVIEGSEHWQTYPLPFLDKNFPEVKWQFPTMSWINKFGVNLEPDDEWYLYKNRINDYDNDGLILNSVQIAENELVVKNKNVVSPQVFLLSPLYYALKSIDFKAVGSAMENEFLKRILLLSTKDNLTKANYIKQQFPPLHYVEGGNFWNTNFYYNITTPGTYYVKYRFEETTFTGDEYGRVFSISYAGGLKFAYSYGANRPSEVFEGICEFEVTGNEVSHQLSFQYSTQENLMPVYFLSALNNDNKGNQMHPTIELGRYLPDWTFATYLNEIQNLFNLEITPDDFAKTLKFEFNEVTINNSSTFIVKKSLQFKSYDPAPYTAYLLKYDNDVDSALWITATGTEEYTSQKSDFCENLFSKFKFIPGTFTANLSEEVASRSGIGLMIYDPSEKPFVSYNYLDQTLKIDGEKGIYAVFWKKFIKFLLQSSLVEVVGPFTEIEKNKIAKLKRIFIDHQEYMISVTESTETTQDNFMLKFKLQSITF